MLRTPWESATPTVKQWIYKKNCAACKPPGAPPPSASEIERFCRAPMKKTCWRAPRFRRSAGEINLWAGSSSPHSGLLAQVKLSIGGQPHFVLITADAAQPMPNRRALPITFCESVARFAAEI